MVTYFQIAKRVRALGGGYVKTCWIAHVKSDNGLSKGPSPNRHDLACRTNPCPPLKRRFIERAFRDLGVISI